MRHVVGFVLITSVIASFQLFELPLALLAQTDGKGPDNAGLTLITYLYDVGFSTGDLGLGSAVGWVVAALIFGASLVQLKLSGLATEEQA
jgi:ABC-type sugar transport system permease subunit